MRKFGAIAVKEPMGQVLELIGVTRPDERAANLITRISLDRSAADRWLMRGNVAEAREALRRVRAHTEALARHLDHATRIDPCAPAVQLSIPARCAN